MAYSPETEEHALAAARWWLNQSRIVSTQQEHLNLFWQLQEVPFYPYDLLLQGQITEGPAGPVKTDVEVQRARDTQDAEDAMQAALQGLPEGPPPVAQRGRGGRGRGRHGRARAAQGGRCTARGSQDLAPEGDSSEMGSASD